MDTKKYLNIKYLSSQPLFANIASLGLVQLANYIIPIIIIPFVVRALGAEAFGRASYAQNIVSYLTILVNFGFDYSATQDVAINRENKSALQNIFWTVIRFKVLLLCASFVILFLLYFFSSKVHEDPILYLYAALINVGFVFFPNWFFQGMEKMAKMSLFNFVIKLLGALLVVLLVSSPDDYRLYLLILSLSYALVGVLAMLYVIRKFNLTTINFTFEKSVIKKSFPIFLNTLFASLYTISGMTILGIYVSDAEVGIYSGAYKIIMAFVVISSMPINVALFPMISREFNKSIDCGISLVKKAMIILLPTMFIYCSCIFLFAPQITKILLGTNFNAATEYIRLFSLLPLLVTFASLVTIQCLYGLGQQKYAPIVGSIVGTICVIANFLLIPEVGSYGAIYTYLGAELLEIFISGMFVWISLKNR